MKSTRLLVFFFVSQMETIFEMNVQILGKLLVYIQVQASDVLDVNRFCLNSC